MLTGLDIYYRINCSHGSAGYMFCKKTYYEKLCKIKEQTPDNCSLQLTASVIICIRCSMA